MICRCKHCGSALKYNPTLCKMVCSYCGSSFKIDELRTKEFIEYNVYSCTACGGELRLNGLEASTFCPYCGQPSIVYSRLSKELQPDEVVPFSVSKEEAIVELQKTLIHKLLVPKRIRHFSVDSIRGIYIPFWLFDYQYTGRAIVSTNRYRKYHYRYGECKMTIPVDASKRLSDESSERLWPYDLSKAQTFQISFLSGFYTDCFDVDYQYVESKTKRQARDYYYGAMFSSISGVGKQIIENDDELELNNIRYVFLPVWFLTFHYKGNPYTFLINGQTKKIVGAVPNIKSITALIWALFFAVMYHPANWLIKSLWANSLKSAIVLAFLSFAIFKVGLSFIQKLTTANELTKSKETEEMVSNREGEH